MLIALLSAALAINQGGSLSPSRATMAPNQPNYTPGESVKVESVTNPAYSFPGLDDRREMNGRLFVGRPIIGGMADHGRASDAEQAAASYGAYGEAGTRGRAQVEGLFRFHPTTTVEFSPWTPVPEQQRSPYTDSFSRAQRKMALRAEDARQQWLKDNNYTGGVRTFVNDATMYAPRMQPRTEIQPRGVIEVNPEVPAFKSRMHVDATPEATPAAAPTRVTAPAPATFAKNEVVKVVPKTELRTAQVKPVAGVEQEKIAAK